MTLSVTKDSKPKLVGIGISLLFTLASSSISHTNSEYYQFRGLERSVSTSPALPTAGAAQGADTGPTGIASVERQSGIGRSWTIATAGGWDYRKFRSQVGKLYTQPGKKAVTAATAATTAATTKTQSRVRSDRCSYGFVGCPSFLRAPVSRDRRVRFPSPSALSPTQFWCDPAPAPPAAALKARERVVRTGGGGTQTSSNGTMLGAWRCSGNSNAELAKNLIDAGLVHSPRVVKAMQATDRGFYVAHESYEDRPQPIGFKATISAPHMHAHALEVLEPVVPPEGGKVLDVGCGSGYLTAALARLVGKNGVCYGMDYIPNLVALSKANLERDDPQLLASGNVRLKTGDGWKGWAEHAPFDAIHVGAAAERIPEELVRQLKVGGRMVIPVGPASESQALVQVDRIKADGPISESYTAESLMSVVYVPLVNGG